MGGGNRTPAAVVLETTALPLSYTHVFDWMGWQDSNLR